MKLIGSIVGGALAGAVATYAMDRLWFARYRESGGEGDFIQWEFSDADSFEGAAAPARFGKEIAEKLEIEIPESAAGTTTNVVHWATGAGWGALAGLTRLAVGGSSLKIGLGTGVIAWGTAYAVLGSMGIYRPIWEYDIPTLQDDLTAHLLFGGVLGVALKPAICLLGSD